MRVLIVGATGLVGKRLVVDRLSRGDSVRIISRDRERAVSLFAADANPLIDIVEGDVTEPGPWQSSIDGCDAVIHLAGANLSAKRWTESFKRTLYDSRVDSTRLIAEAIDRAANPPGVFVCASAVGIYGDTGDDVVDEHSDISATDGFLAELCRAWEAASQQAGDSTRIVNLRLGIVFDDRGGALIEMMKPFRFFMGGPLGSGQQYISWIHYRDLVTLVDLALRDGTIRGPMNAVAPQPIPQRDLAAVLGEAMGKPSFMPTPRLALRLGLGEFANELVKSQRVEPAVANARRHHFLFPDAESAVHSIIADLHRRQGHPDVHLDRGFESGAAHEEPPAEPIATAPSEEIIEHPAEAAARHRPRRAHPIAPIRLVAVDVDGTLLNSEGRLPQSAIDACRTAVRQGCMIVPATARPPRSMRSILQTLGLTGPTINYNGAIIWDVEKESPLFHEALQPQIVREVIDRAREVHADLVVSVEILDKWYTDRVEATLPTKTSREFRADYVGELDSFLHEPVTKLMLLAPQDELGPVFDLVRDFFWEPNRVAVFITDPHIIQIAHPNVDKRVALARIAESHGISRDEVLAIGDGPNDVGMIEWAGFSVAVANACESVQSLADVVVPGNDDHGFSRALQRYVLSP